MLDFEKMREQKTVVIFSQRIAEKLVFRYGLKNLIAIEKSNIDEQKNFKQMVEELAWLKNDRENTEQEYYNIIESEPDNEDVIEERVIAVVEPKPVKSIDDVDLLGEEESAIPKKRGRKKKVVEVIEGEQK